jgi:UDP-N-acetylglucosamine 2-epimerase (non-hydrolysing)
MNLPMVCIVVGTRPEVIKMAPVYRALARSSTLQPFLLSTGQHREMLDQALQVFELEPDEDLQLMIPGQDLTELTAAALRRLGMFFTSRRPEALLVQGDTTTVFAAALAGFLAGIPVGHVEAGLRTGDMCHPFPEEMNRKLTAPLARWHFCPTERSRENLIREGIAAEHCSVTGNTVIDALMSIRTKQAECPMNLKDVLTRLGISDEFAQRHLAGSTDGPGFVLLTGHRRESFGEGFEQICNAIVQLIERFPGLGVVYPVHLNPRVQEPVRRMLGGRSGVALCEPANYEDFVWLMDRCRFVLTDSGGVQEEAPSLGKPVLVMRETTERPEGVEAGTCRLVGTDPSTIVTEALKLLTEDAEYRCRSNLKNPYGDGHSAERIVSILEEDLGGVPGIGMGGIISEK